MLSLSFICYFIISIFAYHTVNQYAIELLYLMVRTENTIGIEIDAFAIQNEWELWFPDLELE